MRERGVGDHGNGCEYLDEGTSEICRNWIIFAAGCEETKVEKVKKGCLKVV